MLAGLFFVAFRLAEMVFLIPVLGMLSSIVHGYVTHNEIAPSYVLVLFIVIVIASVWAFFTMLFYGITKRNGHFVALLDLMIFGALIGGVVVLGPVKDLSCGSPNLRSPIYLLSGPFVYQFSNYCNLLKASFGISILLIILFFTTTLISLWVHHHHRRDTAGNRDGGNREVVEERRTRRSSRRRGASRSRASSRGRGDYERGQSRDPSRNRSRSRRRPEERSYVGP